MGSHRRDRDPITPADAWRAIRGRDSGTHEQGQDPLPPPIAPAAEDNLVFQPRPVNVDWEDKGPAGGYRPGQIEDYLRDTIADDDLSTLDRPPRAWRSALIFTAGILLALIVGWLWGHAAGGSATALQTGNTARIMVSPGPTITAPGATIYRTPAPRVITKPGPTATKTITQTAAPVPAAARVTITAPPATKTVAGPTATVTTTEEIETCYRVRSGVIVAEIECP